VKFTLYWGASDYGRGSFDAIKNHVKIGDEVVLRNEVFGANHFRVAYVNGLRVAQLRKSIAEELSNKGDVNGFIVSSIYTHTYEETVRSDEEFLINGGIPSKLNGRPFANNWTEDSKKRGYIYLIDFSGYGKLVN
jgi:ATP-dependent DNA helicase RecQ